MTWIYLPDYFFGRTRTTEGVLSDPINIALDGPEWDLHVAMRRAGWVLAEERTLSSAWSMVRSTPLRRSYPSAPVSDLYLMGRRHDFTYQQEVGGTTTKRHHVRFWRMPPDFVAPGGYRSDWLAAGTYDRAVGFSFFTLQITHRIDENIDVERDYLVDTVRFADPEVEVEVIEEFSTSYHDRNGQGDRFRTDGDLPVIDVTGAASRSDGASAIIFAATPPHRRLGDEVPRPRGDADCAERDPLRRAPHRGGRRADRAVARHGRGLPRGARPRRGPPPPAALGDLHRLPRAAAGGDRGDPVVHARLRCRPHRALPRRVADPARAGHDLGRHRVRGRAAARSRSGSRRAPLGPHRADGALHGRRLRPPGRGDLDDRGRLPLAAGGRRCLRARRDGDQLRCLPPVGPDPAPGPPRATGRRGLGGGARGRARAVRAVTGE
ncbi:LssY C-terminal domain-containing protein [Brachybacterium sp. GPGPB12]|uniref:LssY C-terminal domain-containing protein n=1 Tax=Brachybacterium sp. GPGPB12 TaxID=3023517 RepID=UPI003134622A